MRERLRSILKDPAERIRVIAMLSISISIITIGIVLTVKNVVEGDQSINPLYIASVIVTVLFVVLLLFSYSKFLSSVFFISFTIVIAFQILTGDFYEYQTLYLAVLITGSYFFMEDRYAYAIILIALLSFVFLFLFKENPGDYSPDMFPISLFTLILISIYTSLNIWVHKLYIKELTRNRDDLEKEVNSRTEELKKAKEYAEFLFRKSPVAIYSIDSSKRIVDVNEMAELITGYKQDEIAGKTADILNPEKEDNNPLFSGKNLKENETVIVTGKGEKRIIERHRLEVKGSSDTDIRYIESFTDLTSMKQLEIFKEDMEGVMRHDLKTPLNSIIGFTRLLLQDESISRESRDYLRIISNSGKNMLNLINQSLILYKIESGTYEPAFQKVDVLSIIRDIMGELNLQALEKECTFVLHTDRKEFQLSSEHTLLYMIFSNLMKNALEASPRNDSITISVKSGEGYTVTIHNGGVIPHSIRNTFFEKYVTSSKKNGTGLGTYSARIAASVIGATLDFTTDETNGTNLNIHFPAML
ncbi:PAS domain-containing sensor histidine kinase [Spirochaeta isovalerica]|uniref:histidine kinase n=1 Tax=Spirochaeta isovalerica TaxID=150 RepID=A0A841RBH5_9SPIO|nr:histidine kinase dimerization/phospho-acceptor domain-containing protein [Spirochaeta isovalerica]MBB6479762.1 PAS domain S-box-containing protein [Spirochaeta isovalerica]